MIIVNLSRIRYNLNMLKQSIINKIKRYFKAQGNVLAVYLYGSYATGDETSASDLDLAVILDKQITNKSAFDLRIKYANEISNLVKPSVEIIILNNSNSPVLNQQAIAGQLIFSQDDDKRADFEVRLLREFEETSNLRKIKLKGKKRKKKNQHIILSQTNSKTRRGNFKIREISKTLQK